MADYRQMLADLQRQRKAIDKMIEAIEDYLGSTAVGRHVVAEKRPAKRVTKVKGKPIVRSKRLFGVPEYKATTHAIDVAKRKIIELLQQQEKVAARGVLAYVIGGKNSATPQQRAAVDAARDQLVADGVITYTKRNRTAQRHFSLVKKQQESNAA